MIEMNVDNMFAEKSYEAKYLINGDALSALDRKRMLVHVVADITSKILSAPASNPVGLAITVQLVPGGHEDSAPNLLVTATCPQYELTDSFFS